MPLGFRGPGFIGIEGGIEFVKRRAIRTNDFVTVPDVEEDMRVIEGRPRTDAHEFPGTDFNCRKPHVVMEMRCHAQCHAASKEFEW